MKKVIAITGLGGIGLACARRIGVGFKMVLGDSNKGQLKKVARDLTKAGYDVTPVLLDICSKESVDTFVNVAAWEGELAAVVHTAGISPTMGNAAQIMEINLIGTARLMEAFEPHVSWGTTGIFISSNSAYLGRPLTGG
ncbi:SDR family NAD(P)-dependent oxidoreductase [Olivibacter sp. XZL3]|uniref:SDR family NAD(P)-dependent oxidoreductase n=1 Tax=Olivibacter sp. XZL3 TaxID=1735116 RepID=UPI00141706CF|nr:SDR family NAD(P)-dependent oxidoreductase [Olivibacter sp. XZL3]